MRRDLEVRFHDYWHIGSGRGGGPGIDAHVRRTEAGLPLVPGKTLKGVLRDAVREATAMGWIGSSVDDAFGSRLLPEGDADDRVKDLEENRFKTRAASVRVGSARLGRGRRADVWEQAVRADPSVADAFFTVLHQTALQGQVARSGSLRSVEVAVPMVLWAELEGPEAFWPDFERCLPLIRAIGGGKRRGLGRVELVLHEGVS